MNLTKHLLRALFFSTFLLPLLSLGCENEPGSPPATLPGHPAGSEDARETTTPTPAPAPSDKATETTGKPSPSKKAQLGPGVWLETEGDRRRVLVEARVCLRKGTYGLETLLCRKNTKDYESILSTEANAQVIHAGLLVARAKPGHPVQFDPQFQPPTGSRIKVLLQFEDQGKGKTVPAQEWILNMKTKKPLQEDWVFAGSVLFPNPDGKDKPPLYAANLDGAYICVNNVPSAMLDLPIDSPNGLENRVFDINTDKVPAVDTKVTIILEPIPEKK